MSGGDREGEGNTEEEKVLLEHYTGGKYDDEQDDPGLGHSHLESEAGHRNLMMSKFVARLSKLPELRRAAIESEILCRQKRRAAEYRREDVSGSDQNFINEVRRLRLEWKIQDFDKLLELYNDCENSRDGLGLLEAESIEAEQDWEWKCSKLQRAEESVYNIFERDIRPLGNYPSHPPSLTSTDSNSSWEEESQYLRSEFNDVEDDYRYRCHQPPSLSSILSSEEYVEVLEFEEERNTELSGEVMNPSCSHSMDGSSIALETSSSQYFNFIGEQPLNVPKSVIGEDSTLDVRSLSAPDIDLVLESGLGKDFLFTSYPMSSESESSSIPYLKVLLEFSTVRDRVNHWLFHKLLVSSWEVNLCRGKLKIDDEELLSNWEKLVVAWWGKDDAAKPKPHLTHVQEDVACPAERPDPKALIQTDVWEQNTNTAHQQDINQVDVLVKTEMVYGLSDGIDVGIETDQASSELRHQDDAQIQTDELRLGLLRRDALVRTEQPFASLEHPKELLDQTAQRKASLEFREDTTCQVSGVDSQFMEIGGTSQIVPNKTGLQTPLEIEDTVVMDGGDEIQANILESGRKSTETTLSETPGTSSYFIDLLLQDESLKFLLQQSTPFSRTVSLVGVLEQLLRKFSSSLAGKANGPVQKTVTQFLNKSRGNIVALLADRIFGLDNYSPFDTFGYRLAIDSRERMINPYLDGLETNYDRALMEPPKVSLTQNKSESEAKTLNTLQALKQEEKFITESQALKHFSIGFKSFLDPGSILFQSSCYGDTSVEIQGEAPKRTIPFSESSDVRFDSDTIATSSLGDSRTQTPKNEERIADVEIASSMELLEATITEIDTEESPQLILEVNPNLKEREGYSSQVFQAPFFNSKFVNQVQSTTGLTLDTRQFENNFQPPTFTHQPSSSPTIQICSNNSINAAENSPNIPANDNSTAVASKWTISERNNEPLPITRDLSSQFDREQKSEKEIPSSCDSHLDCSVRCLDTQRNRWCRARDTRDQWDYIFQDPKGQKDGTGSITPTASQYQTLNAQYSSPLSSYACTRYQQIPATSLPEPLSAFVSYHTSNSEPALSRRMQTANLIPIVNSYWNHRSPSPYLNLGSWNSLEAEEDEEYYGCEWIFERPAPHR